MAKREGLQRSTDLLHCHFIGKPQIEETLTGYHAICVVGGNIDKEGIDSSSEDFAPCSDFYAEAELATAGGPHIVEGKVKDDTARSVQDRSRNVPLWSPGQELAVCASLDVVLPSVLHQSSLCREYGAGSQLTKRQVLGDILDRDNKRDVGNLIVEGEGPGRLNDK